MSQQQNKLPPIPDISTSQQPHIREGAICDSLRFSYDIDRDSALEYSEDGREIDFQFQDYPEYQFKSQDTDRNQTMDHSGMNRKLEIFQKYRNKHQTEEVNRNSDIVDSFDRIFNMKQTKQEQNPSKYLFKRKQITQQDPPPKKTQPKPQTQPTNASTLPSSQTAVGGESKEISFVLGSDKMENFVTDFGRKKNQGNLGNQGNQGNVDLKEIGNQGNQGEQGGMFNQLSISNVSNNTSGSISSDFQLRQQLNFSNPFTSPNQPQQPSQPKPKLQKQANEAIESRINNFFSSSNPPPVQPSTQLKPEQAQHYLSILSISRPLSTSSVSSSSSNNKIPIPNQNQGSQKNVRSQTVPVKQWKLDPNEKISPLSFSKVAVNETIDPSSRLANPIFDQENRISPLFKKIRKMNSIYPNFNHPLINLENEAKFCNVLATIFEQAFNFLQKITIKALQKAKEPKYFPAQFASLPYFLNSHWEYEKQKQWQILSSTIKPRTNFPRNEIQQSKIKGALSNYRQVIEYYKEKKMELNSEQSIKNYFKIRQKFWSLQRNLRSISQDVYRIYQDSDYPQFYYDYLKILKSPLPAKNDEQTINHHQKVLRILIMNRQRQEPLSCSEVGQTVKMKLERELKFLCPF